MDDLEERFLDRDEQKFLEESMDWKTALSKSKRTLAVRAKARAKKRAAAIRPGSRRLKLPYPRDYSLRVFYGPGLNPSIDQALNKIVGQYFYSDGILFRGKQERDLEWKFETKRSAVAAANRIINRVDVPSGKLLHFVDQGGNDFPQRIRRVEVWEEAPRRILNVGFRATMKAALAQYRVARGSECPPK